MGFRALVTAAVGTFDYATIDTFVNTYIETERRNLENATSERERLIIKIKIADADLFLINLRRSLRTTEAVP